MEAASNTYFICRQAHLHPMKSLVPWPPLETWAPSTDPVGVLKSIRSIWYIPFESGLYDYQKNCDKLVLVPKPGRFSIRLFMPHGRNRYRDDNENTKPQSGMRVTPCPSPSPVRKTIELRTWKLRICCGSQPIVLWVASIAHNNLTSRWPIYSSSHRARF